MTLTIILVAARWGHFAAVFALFGCPLSLLLTRGAAPATTELIFNAANRLLQIAAVTAALSGLAWIAALIVNIAGSFADAATPDTLNAFFFETPFGPIVIARLILLAAGVLALALPRRPRFGVWLGVGAGLIVDQAWLGHAANGGASLFGAVAILLYAIHVQRRGLGRRLADPVARAGAARAGKEAARNRHDPVTLFRAGDRRGDVDNRERLRQRSIARAGPFRAPPRNEL